MADITDKNKLIINIPSDTSKNCNVCSNSVLAVHEYIACNNCFGWFHLKCVLKPPQVKKVLLLKEWFCSPECELKTQNTPISTTGPSCSSDQITHSDLLKAIQGISSEINKNYASLKFQVDKNKMDADKQSIHFSTEIQKLKQNLIDKRIVVNGIAYDPNENLIDTFSKICAVIKTNVSINQIDLIERKYKDRTKQKFKVTFVNNMTKNVFLDAARANGPIFMEQLFPTGGHTVSLAEKVFISQDLTPFYQKLLVETKPAKKHGYTVVRYAGFAIKAKKKDEQPIYIHNFEELELFKITAGLNNEGSNIPV
jgi:hypothetical protein